MIRELREKWPVLAGIIVTIILTVFSGCITEKKRAKICATCPVIIKDSIQVKETVTPFDTNLFLSRMGKDMQFDYSENNCCELIDTLTAMMARMGGTITAEENGVKSSIFKKEKKLVFRCEADSLRAVITLLKKQRESTRTVVKEVPARCDKNHRSWFDNIARWWFWISLTAVSVYLFPKIRRVFI